VPITTQHGFFALRNRLKELFATHPEVKIGPNVVDRVFGETGSLESMRLLVNDLERRIQELEQTRPF
jgi:hypothetical protein